MHIARPYQCSFLSAISFTSSKCGHTSSASCRPFLLLQASVAIPVQFPVCHSFYFKQVWPYQCSFLFAIPFTSSKCGHTSAVSCLPFLLLQASVAIPMQFPVCHSFYFKQVWPYQCSFLFAIPFTSSKCGHTNAVSCLPFLLLQASVAIPVQFPVCHSFYFKQVWPYRCSFLFAIPFTASKCGHTSAVSRLPFLLLQASVAIPVQFPVCHSFYFKQVWPYQCSFPFSIPFTSSKCGHTSAVSRFQFLLLQASVAIPVQFPVCHSFYFKQVWPYQCSFPFAIPFTSSKCGHTSAVSCLPFLLLQASVAIPVQFPVFHSFYFKQVWPYQCSFLFAIPFTSSKCGPYQCSFLFAIPFTSSKCGHTSAVSCLPFLLLQASVAIPVQFPVCHSFYFKHVWPYQCSFLFAIPFTSSKCGHTNAVSCLPFLLLQASVAIPVQFPVFHSFYFKHVWPYQCSFLFAIPFTASKCGHTSAVSRFQFLLLQASVAIPVQFPVCHSFYFKQVWPYQCSFPFAIPFTSSKCGHTSAVSCLPFLLLQASVAIPVQFPVFHSFYFKQVWPYQCSFLFAIPFTSSKCGPYQCSFLFAIPFTSSKCGHTSAVSCLPFLLLQASVAIPVQFPVCHSFYFKHVWPYQCSFLFAIPFTSSKCGHTSAVSCLPFLLLQACVAIHA